MSKYDIKSKLKKEIVSVKMLIHVLNGVKNFENPQLLHITFGNSFNISISCASDGESLFFEEGASDLVAKDMGEFGSEIVNDFTNSYPWSEIVHKDIEYMNYIISEKNIIGLGIITKNSEAYIINLGDSIFIFDSFPQKQLDGENLEIREFAQ